MPKHGKKTKNHSYSPYTIDKQLEYIVVEYIKSKDGSPLAYAVSLIVEHIRRKYPKYRRKRSQVVNYQVQKIIAMIQENNPLKKTGKKKRDSSTNPKDIDISSNSQSNNSISKEGNIDIGNVHPPDKKSVNQTTMAIPNKKKKKTVTATAPAATAVPVVATNPPAAIITSTAISHTSTHTIQDTHTAQSAHATHIIGTSNLSASNPNATSTSTTTSNTRINHTPENFASTSTSNPNRSRNRKYGTRKQKRKRNEDTPKKRAVQKQSASSDPRSSDWVPELSTSTVTYQDLGGIEPILQEIRELIEYPITHPEIYSHLGVPPPCGILLHGPPGCGKTLLANAIAGELKIPFMKIAATEIVSGVSGQSEAKLRVMFHDASRLAPCLMFIDEIDAIAPKRATAQREMERRIVAQLLTCMDSLGETMKSVEEGEGEVYRPVIVIGATNRPDAIDSALRRAGRFDREIAIGIPDEAARTRILKVMCRNMRVDSNCDFELITTKTVGYVGADLAALTREAAVIAINRIFRSLFSKQKNETIVEPENRDDKTMQLHNPHKKSDEEKHKLSQRTHTSNLLRDRGTLSKEELAPLTISTKDFLEAVEKVQPSAKREGFATKPDVSWDDIGGLDSLKDDLNMTIIQPIENPEQFKALGLATSAGVLLFGPPGCGKTLVAKAVANESGASFLSIKGPELLNQYVGQSERAVRKVFARARASKPCVIFFDEIDALCPKRGAGGSEGNGVGERVVNQLLTEMDGLEGRSQVFVIAATNRPDIIDPAMLRPGRLDKMLYVQLPNANNRHAIFLKHCQKIPLSANVDIKVISNNPLAEGFSGADVAALVREATLYALKQKQIEHRNMLKKKHKVLVDRSKKLNIGVPDFADIEQKRQVFKIIVDSTHFQFAFTKVFPSVSAKSRRQYDRMHDSLRKARSRIKIKDEEVSKKNT